MKIGLVFDDSLDRPDGVQQYVLGVGAWLSNQGHEVHYLVGETVRTDLPHIHSLARNVQVTFNGNRLTVPLPANSTVIRRLLAVEAFDVLHIMMPYSPMMAAKVIRLAPASTRIVGTFHILPQSWLVRWSTYTLGWWLRRSLRRFATVFAVSPAAARFAEAAFSLRAVGVSPNVVDVSRFARAQPLQKNAPAHGSEPLTVMFLGRLVPRKGCADLLRAARELHRADIPFRLIVCGKGPQETALHRLTVDLGLADVVEFTGFISEEDKPGYVASADIMVFPSTGGESFGIVLIEAMASGRPVVLAAANPGYASVMEDRPEQLFEPGDYQGLATILSQYAQNKKQRQDATDWQRSFVTRFDVARVGAQLVAAYRRDIGPTNTTK
jgi:phosphatidylinositol alpha-mannosyltransferase